MFDEKKRDYQRNNYLTIGKKRVKVKKRPFPGYCELCHKEIKSNPQWHHWDDEHPERGIWVCPGRCHQLCEGVDDDLDLRYREFRQWYFS